MRFGVWRHVVVPCCSVRRRYTWSIGADTMALGAIVCAVAGLIGQS
ncbi:hypothetical protein ACIQVN_17965 [Streptomyces cyaneofuscatus]